MKKSIVSIIFACIMVSFLSCSNEDSLLQPQVSEATVVSNGPSRVAAGTGWVIQPTWNYVSYANKDFSIGPLGFVVSAMNTGSGQVRIRIRELSSTYSLLQEYNALLNPNESKIVASVMPTTSGTKYLRVTIIKIDYATASGSIIVNSKY